MAQRECSVSVTLECIDSPGAHGVFCDNVFEGTADAYPRVWFGSDESALRPTWLGWTTP